MSEIKELRHIGTIKDGGRYTVEVKLIEVQNGLERYDIRKHVDGEHGYQGISLEEESAKNLFLLLGKEFGYLPGDETIEGLESTKGKIRSEFSLSSEQISEIKISDTPVTIRDFVKSINETIDKKHMKGLSITRVLNWLVRQGYLREEKQPATINRTVRKLSERSSEIGITQRVVVDTASGEVLKNDIIYSPQAQRVILENIDEILA